MSDVTDATPNAEFDSLTNTLYPAMRLVLQRVIENFFTINF